MDLLRRQARRRVMVNSQLSHMAMGMHREEALARFACHEVAMVESRGQKKDKTMQKNLNSLDSSIEMVGWSK